MIWYYPSTYKKSYSFCVKTKTISQKLTKARDEKQIETEQGRQRDGAKSIRENTCFDVGVRRCGRREAEHCETFSLEK